MLSVLSSFVRLFHNLIELLVVLVKCFTEEYRPFAGQGHVTMSVIKIGVSAKWLPEMKRT